MIRDRFSHLVFFIMLLLSGFLFGAQNQDLEYPINQPSAEEIMQQVYYVNPLLSG